MGHQYALRRIVIVARSLELRQRAFIVARGQQHPRVGIVGHQYALRRIVIVARGLELRQRAFIVVRSQQRLSVGIVGHQYALRCVLIAACSLELRQRFFIVVRAQQFIRPSIEHRWLDDAIVDPRCHCYHNNSTDQQPLSFARPLLCRHFLFSALLCTLDAVLVISQPLKLIAKLLPLLFILPRLSLSFAKLLIIRFPASRGIFILLLRGIVTVLQRLSVGVFRLLCQPLITQLCLCNGFVPAMLYGAHFIIQDSLELTRGKCPGSFQIAIICQQRLFALRRRTPVSNHRRVFLGRCIQGFYSEF